MQTETMPDTGQTTGDLNLVVMCGTLTVDAEVRTFDTGAVQARYLVAMNVDHPKRRLDVIPVTLWNPPDEIYDNPPRKGDRIWLTGSVQRRYFEAAEGRRSGMEIIADQVKVVS